MINRKFPPKSNGEISFSPPVMNEAKLTNGLNVVYIQKEKLPVFRLSLIVDAGSKYDPADKKGLSNLTSMLIDESADGLSALEISDAFDNLGSDFSVSSDAESIRFRLQTLTENLEESLNIFNKVLLRPGFREEDFNREKIKITTRLSQLLDQPEYLASQIFTYRIFTHENPYAFPVIGYENNINKIVLNDVTGFYKEKFLPETSHLVAVGDYSFEKFLNVAEKYFSDWTFRMEKSRVNFPFSKADGKIFLYDKKNSVQSEIKTGFQCTPRSSENFFPRLLLNSILGGQFTSRINLNLREQKGYTYGARSSFNYLRNSAYFNVSTSVGTENTANALIEIKNELDKIREGVTEQEVIFAKSSLIKMFPSFFETYRQITASLTIKVLHSLPADYYKTYSDNIHNVTLQQIKDTAVESINTSENSAIIVGDKNLLIDQLREAGFEVVLVDHKGKELIA